MPDRHGLDLSTDLRIDTNGEVHKLDDPKNGEDYTLDELQSMVEGYVEVLPGCPFSGEHIGIANEEGLLLGFEYNQKASELFGMELVGPVAVIRRERMK
jgi:hypothetical protein